MYNVQCTLCVCVFFFSGVFHSWQINNWSRRRLYRRRMVCVCSKPLLFISDECLALNYMVFLYSTLFSLHFSAIKGGTLTAGDGAEAAASAATADNARAEAGDVADFEMLWLRLRPMLHA